MADTTPEAAAPATEATPNTTNTPETAPVEQVSTPEEKPYFSNDQLAEMQKFVEANGGYDKAWARMKGNVSAPQKPVEQPTEPVQAPEQPKQPETVPVEPQKPIEGTFGMEEFMTMNYFDRLATEEKYASIADEIRNGKVLEGLKQFNISPVSNGRINDADVRKYLDLYAQTKPATPTSTTPATSQPVDYVPVATEGKVSNMDEATKIQLQDMQLRNSGQPGHPLAEAAKQFVKEYYSKKR